MRRSVPLFLIVCCCLYAVACKNTKTEETTVAVEKKPNAVSYPALGNDVLTKLYADVQNVDIIFYDLPISVNQDDPVSAKNSALYVSPAPVDINPKCKSLARISWMKEGTIIKEADVYLDSLCRYFVFMENNKPVAANVMHESGAQFFNSVITQVQARQK